MSDTLVSRERPNRSRSTTSQPSVRSLRHRQRVVDDTKQRPDTERVNVGLEPEQVGDGFDGCFIGHGLLTLRSVKLIRTGSLGLTSARSIP